MNRLLYAITALALASVFVFDDQTMRSSPDAPTLVQRNPKKPAMSFKLLEVVGK